MKTYVQGIKMNKPHINRRDFARITALSLAAVPLVRVAHAETPKLSESDPMAAALGYKLDTSKVDSTKYPMHKAEQICSNCILYVGDDKEWGACGAFPGKLVAGPGWCTAYSPKPS